MRATRSATSPTCLAVLMCVALVVAAEVRGWAQDEDFVPVTDAMLQDPDPADWLMWRRTLDRWGYSPLDSITQENVGDLRMVWSPTLMPGTQEGTPLAFKWITPELAIIRRRGSAKARSSDSAVKNISKLSRIPRSTPAVCFRYGTTPSRVFRFLGISNSLLLCPSTSKHPTHIVDEF